MPPMTTLPNPRRPGQGPDLARANRPLFQQPRRTSSAQSFNGTGPQRLSPRERPHTASSEWEGGATQHVPTLEHRSASDTVRYTRDDLDRRLFRTPDRRRGSPRIGYGLDDGPRLQAHSRSRTPVAALRRDDIVPMSWAAIAAGGPLRQERRVATASQQEVDLYMLSPRGRLIATPSTAPSPGDSTFLTDSPAVELLEENEQDDDDDLSQSPSVVFDSPSADADMFSDLMTDGSASSISDSGLPPELNSDEALLNPHKYYSEIQDLEANVAGNSGLFLMKERNRVVYPQGPSSFNLRFSHAQQSSNHDSFDEPIMDFVRRHPQSSQAFHAFHLLETRNLMLAVVSNLRRMQHARFCSHAFSAVTVSIERPGVAELVSIKIESILHLYRDLEKAVKEAMEWRTSDDTSDTVPEFDHITQQCNSILASLKLPPAQRAVSSWRKVTQVLDLAIVSYCGAHIERFDEKFIHEDLDRAKLTSAWTYDINCQEGIMMRRRKLRCLNDFLGDSPVWVFQPQSLWDDDQPLYLRTNIEDFADIWGPVWAVKPKSGAPDELLQFNCGAGALIPSASPPSEICEDESYFHWIAVPGPTNAIILAPGAALLIGGGTVFEPKTSQLKENELCTNTTAKMKLYFNSVHMLEDLGTRPAESYRSEDQYNISIGYSGLALGAQRTYKKRPQVTLKEAIITAWRNGGGERNPALLEAWLGVEVSFCTRHARRRRLKDVLNTRSMRNWLEGCLVRDKSAAELAFRDALAAPDPAAFSTLYKEHRHLRSELGSLVAMCLAGLAHSSVDADGVLRALWVPRDDEPAYRVRLKRDPHSWTPLLRDTEEMASFVVISNKCLHADYKYASGCVDRDIAHGVVGSTLLETALVVNEHPQATRPRGLRKREEVSDKARVARWSISAVPRGERFLLANGRLKVIEPFASTRLLVQWESGVQKQLHLAKQSVVRTVGKEQLHHWELKSEAGWPTKPIPLFVLSQYEHKR